MKEQKFIRITNDDPETDFNFLVKNGWKIIECLVLLERAKRSLPCKQVKRKGKKK